jgi:excisionase family DNA binding protein
MRMADTPHINGIREQLLSHKGALRPKEVGELFNIPVPTIYRHAKQGVIPSFRIGGSVRFDPLVLADWYEGQHFGLPSSRRARR